MILFLLEDDIILRSFRGGTLHGCGDDSDQERADKTAEWYSPRVWR